MRIGSAMLLALTTFALYGPVRTFPFINYDDPDYVAANPRVQAGLTRESIQWAFSSVHSSNWHPLTWISHMADCHWFGLNPGAHHLVNVGWHALNVMLLYGWLGSLTRRWVLAWWIAALWAWHPLRVESVAWISERKDVLSLAFGLGCLWAYTTAVRHRAAGHRRAWLGWMFTAWLLLALGLMAKPMLVTLPCVMLLLDFWPLQRHGPQTRPQGPNSDGTPRDSWPFLLLEKTPFLALSLASSIVTLHAQTSAGATVPLEALPFSTRLAQAFVSYGAYLYKTFWPTHLAPFYPYELRAWSSPEVWMTLLALGGLSLLLVLWRSRAPWAVTGWLWFMGTLVPVIGLVQVGQQAMADRYTYLPHIGLFWALVWGLSLYANRSRLTRLVSVLVAGATLAAMLRLSRDQLSHWRNSRTLAEHTLRVTKSNYLAHTQLANALLEEGRLEEALRECERALTIRPHYAEAHNVRANVFYRQQNWAAAREAFEQAIQYNPAFPDSWHGLALVHLELGHWDQAAQAAETALRLWPLHLGAQFALARAHHLAGRWDAARTAYEQVLRWKPDSATALQGLGAVLALQGDLPAACRAYERALALRPDDPEIHLRLGVLHHELGQLALAEQHLLQVLQHQPKHPMAHAQLGHLKLARGDREAALQHYQRALPGLPDQVELLNNLAWLLATHTNAAARNGPLAVELAERATSLTQAQVPLILGTLAAAYAETGRFQEAVATAQKAIARALEQGQPALADRNRQLLQLYESGQAVRE